MACRSRLEQESRSCPHVERIVQFRTAIEASFRLQERKPETGLGLLDRINLVKWYRLTLT